jgi:hypothetical protein
MIRQPHHVEETGGEVSQLRQAQLNADTAKMPSSIQAKRKGDGVTSHQLLQTLKNADESMIRPSCQANETGDEAGQLLQIQKNSDAIKKLPLNQAKRIGDEAMSPQFLRTCRYADAATTHPSLQSKGSVV